MKLSKQNLLIVCPPFFGYDQAIKQAADNLGYSVTLLDARASKSTIYKISLKIFPKITRALTQSHFKKMLCEIDGLDKTHQILFIKGDGITTAGVRALRAMTPSARMTAYLWDSMKNMPGMESSFRLADRVVTFEPQDSKTYGWLYIPTFVRAHPKAKSKINPPILKWDWSFVGSMHSDRHKVLRMLVAAQPELKSFVHCYVQNKFVKMARSIVDPGLLTGQPPPVSYSAMSYSDYLDLISESRAVVDIEHPSQTGITLRTYETLLDGKKLITTNTAVRDCDLYDPSRIAIIDRSNPRIDPEFLATPFLAIPEEIKQGYQIETWLKKVLG